MIFIDESIRDSLGYMCVGFVYCKESPDEVINDAIARAGLKPGVDEYKSGYRMANSGSRHELRDSMYQIVRERCKLGLYIAPVSERPVLRSSVVDIVEKIIRCNELALPHRVFVDEGILGHGEPNDGIEVKFDCDSRRIPGIQLADFAAYHCSYLLKCNLAAKSKKILIDEVPHPLSGEEVDLDWMIRADFRRHFFVEQRNVEEIARDDWFFKLAGYGAFFSPELSPQVMSAAEETFESMYFGCIW